MDIIIIKHKKSKKKIYLLFIILLMFIYNLLYPENFNSIKSKLMIEPSFNNYSLNIEQIENSLNQEYIKLQEIPNKIINFFNYFKEENNIVIKSLQIPGYNIEQNNINRFKYYSINNFIQQSTNYKNTLKTFSKSPVTNETNKFFKDNNNNKTKHKYVLTPEDILLEIELNKLSGN